MANQPWMRTIARELRKGGTDQPRKPDWWARAGVISGFFSSVVIATVGLVISSSFQKAQLASAEATARAQIEITRLKNEDDRRLEESRFAADLLQHLLSNEARHRALAVIMLRRTVPAPMYEEIVGLLANQDPDAEVRKAAIQQLGRSQNPDIAVALNSISQDTTRPPAERALAGKASTSVALAGRLGTGSCLFMAALPGERAYRDSGLGNSGIFSHYLVEAIEGRAGIDELTPNSLAEFFQVAVPAHSLKILNIRQIPFTNFDGYRIDGLLFPSGGVTYALVVGVSAYADPNVAPLAGSSTDAHQIAKALVDRGAKVSMLVDNAATRSNILGRLYAFATEADSAKPTDVIFYYSGHGWSHNGRAYLLTYDSQLTGDIAALDATSLSVEASRAALDHIPSARRLLFLDASLNDPFSGR